MNWNSFKSNWFSLLKESQASFQMQEAVFRDLVDTHSAPVRYYHNLNHVRYLLDLSAEVEAIAERPTVIQLAAWFHDCVYNSQAQDNEINSAIYAVKTLNELNIAPEVIKSVRQIILSTQKHQPIIDTLDCLIFLDLDLAILGASLDEYRKYALAIRKEYSWLSDRDYQRGRKTVLANFIARKRIYFTNYYYCRLEETARANLAAEIALYI